MKTRITRFLCEAALISLPFNPASANAQSGAALLLDGVRVSDAARYGSTFAPPLTVDDNTRGLWRFNETAGAISFADASGSGNALIGYNGAATDLSPGGDTTSPTVTSITRLTPSGQLTSALTVTWRATFSEFVNNVSTADFTLVDISGTLSGEAITSVSASSGTTIDVTASTGSSGGTLRLDVLTGVATITDAAGNSLNQNFTSAETYSIDRTAPVANSLSPADGAVGVALDTHLVITFNEPAVKCAGNIVIKKSNDDSVFETIAVTSAPNTTDTQIARFLPDGALDPSFQPAEFYRVNNTVHDLIFLPDGKLLIAGEFTDVNGYSRSGIARLNGDTILPTRFLSITRQPSGAMQMVLTNPAVRPVIVESCTNLNAALWTTLATNPGVASQFHLLDTNATQFRCRFYRALTPAHNIDE